MSKDDWDPRSFVQRQKRLQGIAAKRRTVKVMGMRKPAAAGGLPIKVDTGQPSSYGNKRRVNRA